MKYIKNTITLLINVLLFWLAYSFFVGNALPIISRTVHGKEAAAAIILILLVATFVWFVIRKKMKKLSFGILSILYSLILFSFFYFNKSSSKNHYEQFHQTRMLTVYDDDIHHFSTIEVGDQKYKNEVELNRCFNFDSIDLKVIDGNLGLKYLTEETKINHGLNCSERNSAPVKNASLLGVELIKKRCFNQAKEFYTTQINLDPKQDELFYYRGLIHLFSDEYELALSDFIMGVNTNLSQEDISHLQKNNSSINELLEKIRKKKWDISIIDDVLKLDELSETSDYLEGIRFCLTQLKKQK